MPSFRISITTILTLLLMSSCAMTPSGVDTRQKINLSLVWPKPPAEPRISFERSINTAGDLGIKQNLFRRFMNAMSGKKDNRLVRPTGVAERGGTIYIADIGGQVLWILDPAHNKSLEVRQAGDSPLVTPAAVTVRSDGAVYVADSWAKKVYLLDKRGKFLGIAAQTGLQRPAGVAYDEDNSRLYVADSAAHAISVYNPDGKRILSWGRRGSADGEFNYPTHICIDPMGRILVTDSLNFRVQAFNRDGKFLWKFGRHGDGSGDFASPKGLAMDSVGHVYVVDALFDAVQIFNPDGALLLTFGEQGVAPGQFWLPGGIFISSEDRIYVTDAYNHRIQVFDYIDDQKPLSRQDLQ